MNMLETLKGQDLIDHLNYRRAYDKLRAKRESLDKQARRLNPANIGHAILWENPWIDDQLVIQHPDGQMVAALMHGNLKPEIGAINGTRFINSTPLKHEVVDRVDIWDSRFRLGGQAAMPGAASLYLGQMNNIPEVATHVVDYRRAHEEIGGPMSYEDAIEYILQRDVPKLVLTKKTNRPVYAIVPKSAIPTDRTYRDSWRLSDII